MTEDEMIERITALEAELETAKEAKSTAIGEKTRAKTAAQQAESRVKELETELQTKNDSSKSDSDRATQALQTQVTDLTAKLTAAQKRESDSVISSAINEVIAKAGVLPDGIALATAYLKAGVTVEDGVAMVDGLPFTEHAATYFASPAARLILAAPANSGGGAQGSNAKGASVITSAGEFMKLAKTDRSAALTANLDPSIEYLRDSLKA